MTNSILWTLAIIVFLGVEASTAALVSIWFAGGALAALIANLCGASLAVQIFVFLVVSLLCIALLRAVAVKKFKSNTHQTNLDRLIGRSVLITQDVDPVSGQGVARINDVEWKVKSENGERIPAGEYAKVIDIDGVKLVVTK